MRYANYFEDAVEEGRITISLLLTMQCNMECNHCMYMCGPNSKKGYMSNEVLREVKRQVDELQEIGIHTVINLIGGEPTINMREFERVLQIVASWGVGIEMTTNGWWLEYKHEKWAFEFFRILAENISDFGLEEGFTVRISNDQWHDAFRKINPEYRLSGLWDEIFYKEVWECLACLTDEITPTDDGLCPHCESEEIESRWVEPTFCIPPEPDPDYPWIYVQNKKYQDTAIPTGRANTWGTHDSGRMYPGRCGGDMLSYTPDGTLMDICCKGAWCEFGTVKDHPLLLIGVSKRYVEEIRPTCMICAEESADYKKYNLKNRRAACERALVKWLDAQDY